jgi:arabinofuranosyltransferase
MRHFLSGDHFVAQASSLARGRAIAWAPLLTSMFLYAGMLCVTCTLAIGLDHGIDDADITLVYARNVARGLGYVYTPGGEHVEGSTSLAWTLFCALIFRVFEHVTPWLFAACLGFCVVTIRLTLNLAAACTAGKAYPSLTITTCTLLATPAFFAWCLSTLMDLALWSMVLTMSLWQVLRPQTRLHQLLSAGACSLVVLTRPEGLLVSPVLIAISFAASRMRGVDTRSACKQVVLPGLSVLVSALGLLIFRLSYFGFPHPNTYYAKVGSAPLANAVSGIDYLLGFFAWNPLHALAALFALRVLVVDGPKGFRVLRTGGSCSQTTTVALALATMLLTSGLITLIEGADHFEGFRVLQAFVPFSSALLGSQLAGPLGNGARRAQKLSLIAACAAMLFSWWRFLGNDVPGFQEELDVASEGRRIAALVQQHVAVGAPLPSIGTGGAGGIAYRYDGRIQDLLGLNWVAMAHAPGDREGPPGHAAFSEKVFWSDPSTLVTVHILATRPRDACDMYASLGPWEDKIFRGLLSSSRFRAEYVGASIAAPEGALVFYARRSFMNAHVLQDALQLEWPTDASQRPDCFRRVAL